MIAYCLKPGRVILDGERLGNLENPAVPAAIQPRASCRDGRYGPPRPGGARRQSAISSPNPKAIRGRTRSSRASPASGFLRRPRAASAVFVVTSHCLSSQRRACSNNSSRHVACFRSSAKPSGGPNMMLALSGLSATQCCAVGQGGKRPLLYCGLARAPWQYTVPDFTGLPFGARLPHGQTQESSRSPRLFFRS